MEISIIIPTLNRAEFLSLTLESIAGQKNVDAEYEIIVVDNGSKDATASVCRSFEDRFRNFIYIFDDMPGQLTGRHRGLRSATGNMLAYLDDDVELNENWLRSLISLVSEHPEISIFTGPSIGNFESDPPKWLDEQWELTPYGGKMCLPLSLIDIGMETREIDPLYAFGLNFCIRKDDLILLKGFHPDCIASSLQKYQGDGETGLTLKAGIAGKRAMYTPALQVRHQVPSERLTKNYFQRWSFYNGVCQSFTNLRSQHGLYSSERVGSLPPDTISTIKGRIKGLLNKFTFPKESRERATFKTNLSRAYFDGYQFHQKAFREERLVRDWVLRGDFFDYSLPYETNL